MDILYPVAVNQNRQQKFIDKTGKKFGKLTVLERLNKKRHNKWIWKCQCDCGNICEVTTDNLGVNTFSCGCDKKEILLKDCVENTRIRNLTMKRPKRERKKDRKDSGIKGIIWLKSRQRWKVSITIQKQYIFLGYWKEEELDKAIEERKKAEEKYFNPILEKYTKTKNEGSF